MKKIIKIITFFGILCMNQFLHPSVLYVIDKRMYKDKETNTMQKYGRGFFAGVEIDGQIVYKPVTPDGRETLFDAGANEILFVRFLDPATNITWQIKLNQPVAFLSGGVIEITGFDGSYIYYKKNNPQKIIKSDKATPIKQWKKRK